MGCFEDFMEFRDEIEKVKRSRPEGKKEEKIEENGVPGST